MLQYFSFNVLYYICTRERQPIQLVLRSRFRLSALVRCPMVSRVDGLILTDGRCSAMLGMLKLIQDYHSATTSRLQLLSWYRKYDKYTAWSALPPFSLRVQI